jgi:hypothetical protein
MRRLEVDASDGFGEAQVGVHARHHDPCIDGHDLDAGQ